MRKILKLRLSKSLIRIILLTRRTKKVLRGPRSPGLCKAQVQVKRSRVKAQSIVIQKNNECPCDRAPFFQVNKMGVTHQGITYKQLHAFNAIPR